RRDETIDRRPHRHTASPQQPIDVRGPYVSVDSARLEKQQFSEETLDLAAPLRLAESLKNLGHHDAARADLVIPRDQAPKCPLRSRRKSIEKVAPDRRVNEDSQVRRPRRRFRRRSRSPSHASLPSNLRRRRSLLRRA